MQLPDPVYLLARPETFTLFSPARGKALSCDYGKGMPEHRALGRRTENQLQIEGGAPLQLSPDMMAALEAGVPHREATGILPEIVLAVSWPASGEDHPWSVVHLEKKIALTGLWESPEPLMRNPLLQKEGRFMQETEKGMPVLQVDAEEEEFSWIPLFPQRDHGVCDLADAVEAGELLLALGAARARDFRIRPGTLEKLLQIPGTAKSPRAEHLLQLLRRERPLVGLGKNSLRGILRLGDHDSRGSQQAVLDALRKG